MRDDFADLPDQDEDDFGPSKSQRKRDATAAQKLGEVLVSLPDSQFKRMPLEGDLKDALLLARRIKDHEGRRRQLQYIGKLMRSTDTSPIQEALDKLMGQSAKETGLLHLCERWRERLLAEDSAMTELLASYPQADVQQLRQLVRLAHKEAEQGQPPKSSRLLFKLLRDVVGSAGAE
ncbi:MAG: DUF615 domain-containing protein [Gammaproteobacteria bacterium]|nr:DUF615 domain-containing protein [Gammaproteobacteria bacterium]